MEGPHLTFEPLAHTIVARLQARPDLCALRFRGTSLSNGDLHRDAMQVAAWLRDAGVGPGTTIGVCLGRVPETLPLLLALWWLGAVYVPLDPALPRERLFSMCATARVEAIVTSAALYGATQSLPCTLFMLERSALEHTPASPPPPGHSTAATDLAYILFTSGSAGTPKGVKISHGNLAALFAGVLPLLDLPEGFRILGCASFSFDIAFFELLAPLLCGGILVLADENTCASPLHLLQLLEEEGVNVVQATPSHWQLLTTLHWTARLTMAIATGEALLRSTAAALLRRAGTLWNLYGPTECTLWCSAQRVCASDVSDTAPAIVSIGHALPGYRLQLESMEPEHGHELVIRGAGVGLGYCEDYAGVSGFRFDAKHDEWFYRTGDLCRRDSRGSLHYLGRRDSQVKHNGYRIELDEIVLLLQQHMSVRRAACLVRQATASAPSLLFACVEFRPGLPNRNKTALNAYLADYLPAWMLPQRYVFLERLPMTPSGKLDRAALLALTEPVCVGHQAAGLDARVAEVFCEVLDIDCIGPCDSFLDAGGSSMLAATLVLTLNERLGSALTLRQVLTTPPTVSSVVQLLRAAPSHKLAT